MADDSNDALSYDDIIPEFISDSKAHLDGIESDFLTLEDQGEDADVELLNKIFRSIHSIKGAAGFLSFHNIQKLSHVMETILDKMRTGQIKPERKYINPLLEGVDQLISMVDDPQESNNEDIQSLHDQLENLVGEKSSVKKQESETNNSNEDEVPKEAPIESASVKNVDTAETPTNKDETADELNYDEFIPEFISDSKAHLEDIESDFLTLEDQGENADVELINKIFRTIHSIKGSAGFLSFHKIKELTHIMETILNKMRTGEIMAERKYIDPLLKGVDQLISMVEEPKESENQNIEPIVNELSNLIDIKDDKKTLEKDLPVVDSIAVVKQQRELVVVDEKPSQKREKAGDRRENQNINAGDRRKGGRRDNDSKQETIRVNVELLNNLMTTTSELVLVRNQQLHLFDKSDPVVTSIVQHLSLVTNELQEGIMRTRMQPVGNVFSKIPRIVRDLSQNLGKNIELRISGNEVEMDKTILEALSDPLTHLIRNCCDHGIDTIEERADRGKPEKGLICVSAFHEGGQINIEIMDDGRGMNTERLKDKTLEKGLRTEEQLDAMTEKELLKLIFLPGFSTAEKVTDVSGRGVGMDVVKSSIGKLGGTIDIDSKLGFGTTILLKLPLTLAIIPCLIVGVDDDQFAIPQVNVEELIDLYDEDVKNKVERTGDNEIYRLRNNLLPLVRLKEVLASSETLTKLDRINISQKNKKEIEESWDDYIEHKQTTKGNGKTAKFNQSLNFAVVKVGADRYGLVVDRILGTEEIVVKPLHPLIKDLKCYSGTTVMGNGLVVLILDIQGISNHSGITFSHEDKQQIAKELEGDDDSKEKQTILLFKNGELEQFGVALPLIKRIEGVKKSCIEKIGAKEFLTIDGVSTLVLRLDKILNVSSCQEREEMIILLPKFTKKPFGILVSDVIGIENAIIELNTESYVETGLLGTAIIRNKMTMFLDIYKLIESAEPDWFTNDKDNINISKQKRDILLVEDCAFFRQLVKSYLESANYNVSVAENGQKGLEVLQDKEFDLIISDIEMPVMNGFDFIKNVRAGDSQPEIPAIALTSLDSDKTMDKAIQSGFDTYELKIDRAKLLNTVTKLLDN